MNVTALAARPIPYNRSASSAPPSSQESREESSGLGAVGRGAAALGGAAAGYVGASVAGVGTNLAGSLMTQVTLGMLPKMQLAEGTVNLVNNVFGLSVGLSSLAAIGAGVAAGAVVAYQASAGAEKVDDAMRVDDLQAQAKGGFMSRTLAELKDYGADLRSSLSNLQGAASFGSAAKSGFDAGSALGAPIGAAAGKVQGLGWGIALGTIAALPIAAAAPAVLSAPLMIGFALAGGALGAKAGEPLGAFAGSLAGGATGAVLGAGYHGIRSLTGKE